MHINYLTRPLSLVRHMCACCRLWFQGLEEGDFNGFTGAILYVFNQDMGESFTPDVRVAWSRLIDFLIQHLKHGFVMARDAAAAK